MLQTAPVTLLISSCNPVHYTIAEGLLRQQLPVLAARILAVISPTETVALEDVSTDTFDIFFF